MPKPTPIRVAIIGAGMSGICMGIKLQEAGIPFTIFEQGSEIGGTWRDNTYPGLFCDMPSRYYTYSFQPNPEWSRVMPPGSDIQDYFLRVTDERGLRSRIRFNTAVDSASYRDGKWWIATTGGEEAFDVLVSATGILRVPNYPNIPGRESFAGASFHSARWDHSVSLDDKRIGLIGTGSTGGKNCRRPGRRGETTSEVFQRTPQWVLPWVNPSYRPWTKALQRRWPALGRVGYRFWGGFVRGLVGRAPVEPCFQRRMLDAACRWNVRLSVRDPDLPRPHPEGPAPVSAPDHQPDVLPRDPATGCRGGD